MKQKEAQEDSAQPELDKIKIKILLDLIQITSFNRVYFDEDSFYIINNRISFKVIINKSVAFDYVINLNQYKNGVKQVKRSILNHIKS